MSITPLKKRKLDFDDGAPSPKRQKANLPFHASTSPLLNEDQRLSILYGVNFNNPNSSRNSQQFFQIRDQVILIEKYLETHTDANKHRSYISSVLNSPKRHEEKMAELGIILFYLDQGKKLPPLSATSYFEMCFEKLEEKVEDIKQSYKFYSQDKVKVMPSGKAFFLLELMAHLLLTKEQRLNVGGIFALTQLFSGATCDFAHHFKFEHREHILIILKQLLTKPQLRSLLEEKVTIHKEMEYFVRLDLKLRPTDKVTSVHVVRASLMALLFDLRQHERNNCFSISSVIYARDHSAYHFLSKMLEWLKAGHFTCGNYPKPLPIAALTQLRLQQARAPETPCHEARLHHLWPVETIFRNLDIDLFSIQQDMSMQEEVQQDEVREEEALRPVLKNILKIRQQESLLPLVEDLFASYSHSALMEMMLSVLEFPEFNNPGNDPQGNSHRNEKMETLDAILAPIKNVSTPEFYSKLQHKAAEKLWFIENCDKVLEVANNKIITRHSTISNFNGDKDALSGLLVSSGHLMILDNNLLTPIKTITELRKTLSSLIFETAKECRFNTQETLKISSTIENTEFLVVIANYCACHINNSGITSKNLFDADLLIFDVKGGYCEPVLKDTLQLNIRWSQMSCISPCASLFMLHTFSHESNNPFEASPALIMQSEDHAFTIQGQKIHSMFQSQADFATFIQDRIYNPAREFLNQPIPQHVVQFICRHCEPDEANYLCSLQNQTYDSFRTEFFKLENKNTNFDKTLVDTAYSRILMTPQKLEEVISKLGISLNDKDKISLSSKLQTKFPKPEHPHIIAHFLHKALLSHHMMRPPEEIEKAICESYRLPAPLDLGDSNYGGRNVVDPDHVHVVFRYHFGERAPFFAHRSKTGYKTLNENVLNKSWLVYPKD